MESARCPQPRIQSPTQSAASKGEQMLPPRSEGTLTVRESMDGIKPSDAPQLQLQPQISEKGKITKVPDVSEATHESASVKEPASQGSARPVEEEVQQKVAAGEAGKFQAEIVDIGVKFVDNQWIFCFLKVLQLNIVWRACGNILSCLMLYFRFFWVHVEPGVGV